MLKIRIAGIIHERKEYPLPISGTYIDTEEFYFIKYLNRIEVLNYFKFVNLFYAVELLDLGIMMFKLFDANNQGIKRIGIVSFPQNRAV